MKSRSLAVLFVLAAACRTAPAPESEPEIAVPESTVQAPPAGLESGGLSEIFAKGLATTGGSAIGADACPPSGAEERQHCVWFTLARGAGAAATAKKMKAAGFDAEADGDKLYAWWTPAQLNAFFGKKPHYVRTGGGSGGMVCLAVLPKGATPPAALRSSIAGWAVDDPVCEM